MQLGRLAIVQAVEKLMSPRRQRGKHSAGASSFIDAPDLAYIDEKANHLKTTFFVPNFMPSTGQNSIFIIGLTIENCSYFP